MRRGGRDVERRRRATARGDGGHRLPRRVFPPGTAGATTTHTVAIPSARPAVSLIPRSPPPWCAACVHDGGARWFVCLSPAARARAVWGLAVPAQQGDHRRPLHWPLVTPRRGPCAGGRADLPAGPVEPCTSVTERGRGDGGTAEEGRQAWGLGRNGEGGRPGGATAAQSSVGWPLLPRTLTTHTDMGGSSFLVRGARRANRPSGWPLRLPPASCDAPPPPRPPRPRSCLHHPPPLPALFHPLPPAAVD